MKKEQNKILKFTVMMFLAAVVGVSIGVVGSLFHMAIDFVIHSKAHWIHEWWKFQGYVWVPYVVSSMIMVYFAIILVRKFGPEAGGSGVQEIEGILADKREMRAVRVLVIKFFGGISGLGGGMVMGREGPTIQMGGALGNIAATIASLSKEDAKILIAAGAGAGLAVAFNAPVAGMLFVFEEMRRQFKFTFISVPSVVVSSIVGIYVLYFFMGDYDFISVKPLLAPATHELWVFLVFGVFFGFLGWTFNTFIVRFADKFSTYNGVQFHIASLITGAMIGFLLYKWPDTVGEGFGIIHTILHNDFSFEIIAALFLARFLTTLSSYGTSAPGGIFAPMLAIGTIFGIGFGIAVHYFLPLYAIDPYVFAIVGMSALFAATVGAPFTGIMLILELTGHYNLVAPVLVGSLAAFAMSNILGVRPIYSLLLERTLRIAKFGVEEDEKLEKNAEDRKA